MNTELYTQLDAIAETGPADPASPVSVSDRVYLLLRNDVMSGGLSARERLTEVGLARRYSVSRTPVREALARVFADELIERRDGAYYVMVPNLQELRDLYELRVTLELRGIARAIEDPTIVHDPAILASQIQWWRTMKAEMPQPDPHFVLLDERFHTALSRSSGNPALTTALTTVNEKIRRVRMYDFLTEDRIVSTVTEHLEILELVAEGRLEDGHRALHAHVGESLAVVLERAQRALTAMTLHGGMN